MYQSYVLELGRDTFKLEESNEYNDWFEMESSKARESIKKYVSGNEIDVEKLESDWFPAVEADIFLSHSHVDEDFAKRIAGHLYKKFGLKTFIDSMVWGYAGDLLYSIHDEYCRSPKPDDNLFSYQPIIQSTSHIDMLLSVALQKMIDSTECLFFLKSKNSVCNFLDEKTYSPWIYSEIQASKMVRRREPKRREIRLDEATAEGLIYKSLPPMRYPLPMAHLIPFGEDKFSVWLKEERPSRENALDWVYENVTKKAK